MAKHLTLQDKINQGSYYTPKHLVDKVYNLISPYISRESVILDAGVGRGAFASPMTLTNTRFIGIDIDKDAIESVADEYNNSNIELHCCNALTEATRNRKYLKIAEEDGLIIIGNPPYNDITSQNKMLIKDSFLAADEEIKTRDLGITFMRMYNRLAPDIICILHPLSYLIKRANFNLLKEFKDNYRLEKGVIFSSNEFNDTSKLEFPVLISLYIKNRQGMDYEYINNFKFNILNSKDTFCLRDFTTTDNIIHKYPNQAKAKDTGIYFHTFRDNNSIKRSATFRSNKTKSSIHVTVKELYKYCYLDWYKDNYHDLLHNIDYKYVFGNLSPLLFDNYFNSHKYLIKYSYKNNKELRKIVDNNRKIRTEIEKHYNIKL